MTKEEVAEVILEALKAFEIRFEKKMDKKLDQKLDQKLAPIIEMLVEHDYLLKTKMVTRDEFNEFRSENAAAHDAMFKRLDRLDTEFVALSASHNRLEADVRVLQLEPI